jgi:hypothetical protein
MDLPFGSHCLSLSVVEKQERAFSPVLQLILTALAEFLIMSYMMILEFFCMLISISTSFIACTASEFMLARRPCPCAYCAIAFWRILLKSLLPLAPIGIFHTNKNDVFIFLH